MPPVLEMCCKPEILQILTNEMKLMRKNMKKSINPQTKANHCFLSLICIFHTVPIFFLFWGCITAVLIKSLLQLPVHDGITFKILLLIEKVLNALAPQYISDLLTIYNLIRSLRSSDVSLLAVPRIKSKSAEDTSSYCSPGHWNKLPADLRSITTVST